MRSAPWILILSVFTAAWVIRTFILTGCLAYPFAALCFDVSWAVPVERVERISSDVTSWARQPGPGYDAFRELWNTEWIRPWLLRNMESDPVVIARNSILIGVLVASVQYWRSRKSGQAAVAPLAGGWGTVLVVFAGLLFWFVKAPDPRFSWAFFAIISIAMVHWAFSNARFPVPQLRYPPLTKHLSYRAFALLTVAVFLSTFLLPWSRLQPPDTKVEAVATKNGWPLLRPAEGENCWAQFPCSYIPVDRLEAHPRNGRMTFMRESIHAERGRAQ